MSESITKKPKVAFIHPDLGIGGAERLVVDAAIGLQNKGYDVTIFTSHCDKSHCFEEVKNGLLKVVVLGDALPTQLFGKFSILCANLRQVYLTMSLVATKRIQQYEVYVVDQLSTCIPLLRLNAPESKVLFYCHFPDQLLASRDGLLKKIYRIPFDWLEQFTMGVSQVILVNSYFTKRVFAQTFRSLAADPKVVYPCVSLEEERVLPMDIELKKQILKKGQKYYLSINRYERKKNIELAIKSFAQSRQKDNYKLVISGGYDLQVTENVQYLKDLQQLASDLKLSQTHVSYPAYSRDPAEVGLVDFDKIQVIFLTSVSSSLKELLLKGTEMLLYTPSNEHFGIVPLEAMKLGIPVLAVNNGGPVETVIDYDDSPEHIDATGWLRPADAKKWSEVLDKATHVLEEDSQIFKRNGLKRVRFYFSREAMSQNFENTINKIIWQTNAPGLWAIVTPGLAMLAAQYLIVLLFKQQSWPYVLLALFSLLVLRSTNSFIYWISAFAYKNYST